MIKFRPGKGKCVIKNLKMFVKVKLKVLNLRLVNVFKKYVT